jgi:hypothetical protein
MSKSNVILPQLSDEEVDKLYTYFTQFDKNYSKFKGSKREYIVYVIGIVQSKKKNKKMEGGAPKAKPAGKAAAATPEAIRNELVRKLSGMLPKKLFTLIEDTVDKLDKMMEKLVDEGVNADETLSKMRKELKDIPAGEERTLREEEIKPVETAARIRESGRVGEEKALEVLNKYSDIFSSVTRLPSPAPGTGIEPILDLIAMSKTKGGKPTLIEVKNRVHGAPDVGIQQTKIMAALYLMSPANKTYEKKLPIVVFIRGDPKASNIRDQQDRAETFDLVKVLKSIGVNKETLTPAELKEYTDMVNATNGVNMVASQQSKWVNKTRDILPLLASSGYGTVLSEGQGFKTFKFDIKPDSILVESGEMEPIYTQTYKAPVEKTAAEVKAEGRQKALQEIDNKLSGLTEYGPDAKSIMINAAKKNKIETDFGMSIEEYKELYRQEFEKRQKAREAADQAASKAKKQVKVVALSAAEKAREEAEQKALDEAAAAAELAGPRAAVSSAAPSKVKKTAKQIRADREAKEREESREASRAVEREAARAAARAVEEAAATAATDQELKELEDDVHDTVKTYESQIDEQYKNTLDALKITFKEGLITADNYRKRLEKIRGQLDKEVEAAAVDQELKKKREKLSKHAEREAEEEKDPEIRKELMEIAEDVLDDSTTEEQYNKDVVRLRKLIIGSNEKTKGVSGSGKKMLCRFSSGLGIY